MVKQFLAAIVLLVYFCATTGFVISLHYCMDRFDSAELGATKNDRCNKCGMHKNGCCWDDVKVVRLQTSHLASKINIDEFAAPAIQSLTTGFILSPFENVSSAKNSFAHSPPLSEQDTYLRNRVFRI